jgi:hypothetical protein
MLYIHVFGESNPKLKELVLNPVVNIFTIKYVQTKAAAEQTGRWYIRPYLFFF